MLYALMVIAVTIALGVTALCMKLKWDKAYIVAPLQFIMSFAVTMAVANWVERPDINVDFFWTCAAVSAIIPIIFVIMRVFFGPLSSRKPGIVDKDRSRTEYKNSPT